jgi:hypothetical protein
MATILPLADAGRERPERHDSGGAATSPSAGRSAAWASRAGASSSGSPIGRLVLDCGVPPAIEVGDVVRRREVEPGAPRLERQHDQRRAVRGLEAADHLVARRLRGAAVEPQHLAAEALLQVRPEKVAELGELGKAQGAVALCERLVQNLLEPGHHGPRRSSAQRGSRSAGVSSA